MQYQIPAEKRRLEGGVVIAQDTSIYSPNQPEMQSFAQRESWRSRLVVAPWLENLASDRGTTVTTGLDWVQPLVDVSWL